MTNRQFNHLDSGLVAKATVRVAAVTLLMLSLVACEKAEDSSVSSEVSVEAPSASTPARKKSFAQVARGSKTFAQSCAVCHGEKAVGAPNWRVRNSDGSFPPPALNGTAHAWHHPMSFLENIIVNGSPTGGAMPPWKDKLSEQEIADVIAYFQSLWPDEIYRPWDEANQRALNKAASG